MMNPEMQNAFGETVPEQGVKGQAALLLLVTELVKHSSSSTSNSSLRFRVTCSDEYQLHRVLHKKQHRHVPALKRAARALRDSAFHKFNYLQNLWSLTPNLNSVAGHRLLKNKVSVLPKQ